MSNSKSAPTRISAHSSPLGSNSLGSDSLASDTARTVTSIRRDGWTLAKQSEFLRTLSACHSVTEAARSVGMSRQSAYRLRARMKGEPFDMAWTAAFRCQFDALAELAMDRAMNGVEVPHLYKGELVHTSRKFDERLTVALLAMRGAFRPANIAMRTLDTDYTDAEFGQLVDRLESGPETWAEESRMDGEADEIEAVKYLENRNNSKKDRPDNAK